MLAERDDVRKRPGRSHEFTQRENVLANPPESRLVSRGLAQINLEVEQFTIFFESHDAGDVQPGIA